MVIRPERTVYNISFKANSNTGFNLLSLGALRRDKNIPFLIDCLMNRNNINYTIAGKANRITKITVDEKLEKENINNINRLSGFITDQEYQNLFKNANFMVLADEPEPTCKSNGTFVESIFNSLPVIAPDFEPYRYYIKKYKIGFLYKSGDKISFIEAVENAKKTESNYFKEGIIKFQKDHIIDDVAENVKQQLILIQ